jgi:hypothetical protein
VPGRVRLLHVELDEGAGQLLTFPRRRRLAGAQANDRVLYLNRLADLELEVPDDSVALVEEAKDGDAILHRRDADRLAGTRSCLRKRYAVGLIVLFTTAAPRHQQQRKQCTGRRLTFHAQSGVQGW